MGQLGILGIKRGMTQVFGKDENIIPVTVVEAGPCVVTQIKTEKADGYNAIQMGFEDLADRKATKPIAGQFKKSKASPKRYLAELRVDDPSSFKLGQKLSVDIFDEGTRVNVSGNTIGRGFQGVVKRHGFHGGPSGHGSRSHRVPGSIGNSSSPSRVFAGKKMPGQMGNKIFSAIGLEIVKVDPENNVLLIRGSVPGHKGSLVYVKGRK